MDQSRQNGHVLRRPPRYLLLARFLGCLPDKLGFFLDCGVQYGDVVDLAVGPPVYLLNDPEDVRYVLDSNHQNYTKTRRLTGTSGQHLSGKGLLTSSGADALRQRRLLQPLFARSRIGGFAEVMISSTEQMLARWRSGTEVDIAHEMLTLTQRIMGKTLFSVDMEEEARELADALTMRRRYIRHHFRSPFPFPEYLPTPINRQYRRAMRCIDSTIHGMIAARRGSEVLPQDLLSLLMQLPNKDGVVMNDEQVRDEALTVATTGYETIGLALAWTWYLLAQNPDVGQKLTAEVLTVLGDRTPNADDVPKLRYTEMVFAEALRLYPPTWLFVRVPQHDDVLPSGARIRAGAKLYLCPYAIQRNPRYFPDPERFNPERFTEEAKQTRPRFAYFPFAGGPRVCLGQGFALLEGTLVLACMARRVSLASVPGRSVVPVPGLTLSPKDGIYLRVRPPESQP